MNYRCVLLSLVISFPLTSWALWEKELFLAVGLTSGITMTLSAQKVYAKYQQWQAVKQYKPETKIGVLKLQGEISSSEQLVKTMYRFAKDPSIKGVLLVINSGGGAPGASEMLRCEIQKLSSTKPVVVLIENICASGAYLAAVGADWIIAPSKAEVGSIGVVSLIERYDDTEVKNNGFKAKSYYEFFKAGKYKALTSPYHGEMTDDEIVYWQTLLEKGYENFAQTVAAWRNLSLDDKEVWAEGKIFWGYEACQLGLIDQEGGYTDALEKIKELIQNRGGDAVADELIFVE